MDGQVPIDCQISSLGALAEGRAPMPPASLLRRLKLLVRRHLSPAQERKLKMRTNALLNRFARLTGRGVRPPAPVEPPAAPLQAGDLVRVRSVEEIESTLNHWRQLKGCTFMAEMAQYCGTRQRVLKRLERFVDERDLRAKRASGIVLLEGAICQGTADFGRCDRACHLFWREEWLEKMG